MVLISSGLGRITGRYITIGHHFGALIMDRCWAGPGEIGALK